MAFKKKENGEEDLWKFARENLNTGKCRALQQCGHPLN